MSSVEEDSLCLLVVEKLLICIAGGRPVFPKENGAISGG